MNKRKILLPILFALIVIVLGANFVMAASTPTGLIFNRNVTAVYDEGNFSVNWTNSGDAAQNYSVYIFVNNVIYNKSWNSSPTGYSFNNWTEGNYTFKIGGLNITNFTETNSTTNISIYVDRTAPIISLSNGTAATYTNGTAKKNTSQLTLTISVSDANSGTTGSICLVDINGTNESIAVNNGWCNSTAFNLTGLIDGNRTIKVYVNDTVGIFGLNNSYYVQMDTTNPTLVSSCSPEIVQKGETFPCYCSGTDATSGINLSAISGTSTSPDAIPGTLSTGTFTYSCSVFDYAGNSVSAITTYYVYYPSSGRHVIVTTNIIKSQIFTKITPGVVSIMKNFDAKIGLKEIQINVNNPAQSVKVTVTKYDDKPAEVSVEKTGKTYQYMQIKVDNIADKLDKATLVTKINKDWVSENALDKENLALFKFDETSEQWDELSTVYSSEDDTYYYYTTDVSSFSYFAIGEKSLVSGEEGGATSGEGTTTSNLMWLWIVIGIAVLIAVVVIVMIRKKK